jgi:hypothetical protein
MMGHMKRETGNDNKETTMSKSDGVGGIEAIAEYVYLLTDDAMSKAVGV